MPGIGLGGRCYENPAPPPSWMKHTFVPFVYPLKKENLKKGRKTLEDGTKMCLIKKKQVAPSMFTLLPIYY